MAGRCRAGDRTIAEMARDFDLTKTVVRSSAVFGRRFYMLDHLNIGDVASMWRTRASPVGSGCSASPVGETLAA